jgi:hypothetical protein
MTRREVGFLLIGIELGGVPVAAGVMVYLISIRGARDSFGVLPNLLLSAGLVLLAVLVAGLILLAYRPKTKISE